MDQITKAPGLQHIAEEILMHLDKKSLLICRQVNQSWKNIVECPMFLSKRLDNAPVEQYIKDCWKWLVKEHGSFLRTLEKNEFELILQNIYEFKPKNPLGIGLIWKLLGGIHILRRTNFGLF